MELVRQLRASKLMALKEGSRGQAPLKDFRMEANEIWLYDIIDDWFGVTASDIVYALQIADGDDVVCHVNCPGGMVTEGLAIYNTFKNYPGNIQFRVEGLAASAASFIILAGNEIVVEPTAMVMIHDAWDITIGNADDHQSKVDLLNKASNNVASIYQDKAGGSVEEWRTAMKEETWYVGQEAVDAGLADRVGETVSEAQNKWDRSLFNKIPSASKVAASLATTPVTGRKANQDWNFDMTALRQSLKGVSNR